MKLISHKLPYGRDLGSTHEIYFLGDIHMGARLCRKKSLRRDLAEIAAKDPKVTHLVLMGDHGDYINRSDARFDEEEIDPDIIDLYSGTDPNEQTLDALVDYLSPVKPYIRCILRGNHGQKDKRTGMWQRYDRKLSERHYLDLPDLYGGYSAFVRFQFAHVSGGKVRTVVAHVHHGWQGGRKRGAKVNQLEAEMSYFPTANLLIRGHSHELFWDKFDCLVPNSAFTDIKAHHVGVGHSGTYLGTASIKTEGYAERKGYRPAPIGCLRVTATMTDEGVDLEGTI